MATGEGGAPAIAIPSAGLVWAGLGWDGWQQVSASAVGAGERIHVRIDGRYVEKEGKNPGERG